MKELKLFEIVPAGQPLLDIIHSTFSEFDEVTEVRITAFELPPNKLAAFQPQKRIIIIDMGNAANPAGRWMKHGATYVASTWFNLLFGVFHERAHLRQVRENAELKGLAHATEIMEAAANAEANSSILAWAENNPAIPGLDDLGFVGEYLKESLNKLYSEHPIQVVNELELQGTNIAAFLKDTPDGETTYQDTKTFITSVLGPIVAKEQTSVSQDQVNENEDTDGVFTVTYA